jgi:hypothetical protein
MDFRFSKVSKTLHRYALLTTWPEEQKLTVSGRAANNQLGMSVSISGDAVVVGTMADFEGAGRSS